ncbi:hypothetical protein H4R19_000313 [Coemansia spiralis]|nr:hypothetical protein H4R19_000313 [Coemansia spiralis]
MPLGSEAVVSAQEPPRVELGVHPVAKLAQTKPAQTKGMRAHWSAEDDYQFVFILAKYTVCNERQGLVINHKFIDTAIVDDVAAGLENKTPVDKLVGELAQKYATKKEANRSFDCINLMKEMREKLPRYNCEQLNYKHVNMRTRSIVPFRQLFDSGQLYRGKQMSHKDSRRFTKAIIDFFVHIIAHGMEQADPKMFIKSEDNGGKLLEQWLTAMLTHHSQDMVKFLFACGVKLAISFIDSKRVERRAPLDDYFIKATSHSPEQVLRVLKEMMAHIVRSDTYSDYTVPRIAYSAVLPNRREAGSAADDAAAFRSAAQQPAMYPRPPVVWPPAHGPYGPQYAGADAHARDNYRMGPGGMPRYHRLLPPPPPPPQQQQPWGPADRYGYGQRGYPNYMPQEPPYGLPPGGRFVYIPPDGHRGQHPAMDPREAYRAHPAVHAPPRQLRVCPRTVSNPDADADADALRADSRQPDQIADSRQPDHSADECPTAPSTATIANSPAAEPASMATVRSAAGAALTALVRERLD